MLSTWDEPERLANSPFSGKDRSEVQQNFPIMTGETAFLFLHHFIKYLMAGGRAAIDIKNTFLSNADNAARALRQELLESCNLHTVLDCPAGTSQPFPTQSSPWWPQPNRPRLAGRGMLGLDVRGRTSAIHSVFSDCPISIQPCPSGQRSDLRKADFRIILREFSSRAKLAKRYAAVSSSSPSLPAQTAQSGWHGQSTDHPTSRMP